MFARCIPLCLAAALAAQQPTLSLPAFTGFAHPNPDAVRRNDDGTVSRCDGELRFYVFLANSGMVKARLERTSEADVTTIKFELQELSEIPLRKPGNTTSYLQEGQTDTDLGAIGATKPGYYRITLSSPEGRLRHLRAIHLSGEPIVGARACTVERRNAASVHLGYDVPTAQRDDIEWFYCEVTPRTDPIWSYYMATGWHRGYFGMQVNSPTERRVIFSVWDAGNEGVDRKKVAAEDRVQLIAKGEGVYAGDFGNEGTGGHSHLKHAWRLGETFRFLVHAHREGTHTTYSGWFWFAERQQWGLIASFKAPKDGQGLRGLYSFNENFHGANGDLARDCEFGNVWARTTQGEWLALRTARFTCDGHGRKDRLDRSGGVRGERFFLRNGGFDVESTTYGAEFTVDAPWRQPLLDADLPTPPSVKVK